MLPLLFMLLFGILEYGLLFRTGLTISDATRAGARVAVARPRSPEYHTAAAAAVSGALATSGIPSDQIGLLVVYRADPRTGGLKGGGDSDAAIEGCTSNCWKFTWDPAQREYVVHGSTTWPAENQYACGIEAETDYLGVYVRASHQFITGFFRDQQPVTERTVMRLEPLPLSDECKPAAG